MKDKGRIVITIVFFCLLFSMSIGYATYISKTNINGNAAAIQIQEVSSNPNLFLKEKYANNAKPQLINTQINCLNDKPKNMLSL